VKRRPNLEGERERFERALALLISSTKRKKRAVPLTAIADALALARRHLGSTARVAETIGLSGKMLGQFQRANDLQPKVRQLVASRAIDSVDGVVHLAQLPPEAQEFAATALAENQLDSKDLRAAVELYRLEPTTPFSRIIDRVKSSKTQQHYVAEFIVRAGRDEPELRARFEKVASPVNILDVSISGSLGRLVLNKAGYEELKSAARRLGVGVKQIAGLAASGQLK
jgi:hypothetical protein